MKTTTTSFIVALVLTLGLLVSVPSANAGGPLNVDCDVYAATIVDVDAFLGLNNIEFDNLGDLVSSAITNDSIFNDLNDLIVFFSGGAISFDSASQAISTAAKCGLIPQLIGEIAD